MLVSEIQELNKIKLQQELEIQKHLQGLNPNLELINCQDAWLYYTCTAHLSVQAKAPMGEKFLCNKLGCNQIPASEDCGDAKDEFGRIYEFKNSFTNQKQTLNLRQIRLWQNIDFYYCIYINELDLDKSMFYILNKDQMTEEVSLCGSFTHGVSEINKQNKYQEYSITFPVYSDRSITTNRWKKYLSNELKYKILGGN